LFGSGLDVGKKRALDAVATVTISVGSKRFLAANQMFYELAGLEERDVVGRLPSEAGLCISSGGEAHRLEDLWSGDFNWDSECSLITPDGKTIEVLVSARVVACGGEPCSLVMLQDISDLNKLKRELVQISEEEQKRFARDLHDGHCQDLTAAVFFAEPLPPLWIKQTKKMQDRFVLWRKWCAAALRTRIAWQRILAH
jgi:PAS domain S-box-containing protein